MRVRRPVLERAQVDQQADARARRTRSSGPGRPGSRGSAGRAVPPASSRPARAWSGPGRAGPRRRVCGLRRLRRGSGRLASLASASRSAGAARRALPPTAAGHARRPRACAPRLRRRCAARSGPARGRRAGDAGRTGTRAEASGGRRPETIIGRWPLVWNASVTTLRAVDDGDGAAADDLQRLVRRRRWRRCPRRGRCPSSDGDCATTASSRPSRVRCSKCWSMTTSLSRPRPADICAMRCFGVAPEAPNAIMCSAMALAPAEVPATAAPRRVRGQDGAARGASRDDDGGQPELVPAGQEDAGGVLQRRRPASRCSPRAG